MVNFYWVSRLTDSLSQWRALSTRMGFWVDGSLRRALPGRCAFCLSPRGGELPWCDACFATLPWNLSACPRCAEPQAGWLEARPCGRCLRHPPGFDRARAPLRYEGELAGLVQRFKFHASPRAGAVLLELFEAALPQAARRWPEALMAVPLHARRARQRGFDQGEWLARRLARRLEIPLLRAERLRDTSTQRGLDRRERRTNLRGALRVSGELPRRVALVDDVMTTGATLDALATACRRAGAGEIEAWAMARTPLEGEGW